ncbi:MAG: porin family protein [bacterium]
MKKTRVFWVAPFVLLTILTANAQQRIGFVGGLNFANFASLKAVSADVNVFGRRTLFGLGGVLELGMGKNTALRLEPMYLQKGAKGTLEGLDFEWNLVYFEVPAFLKLNIVSSPYNLYFLAGPTLGLILTAKMKIFGIEFNIVDATSSIDFGLGFGAGFSFPIGKNAIFVEGHYTHGFANIADEGKIVTGGEELEFEEGDMAKNTGIQIMAGVTFPFGGY